MTHNDITTDRELLELAAKAAGIAVNPWHEKYGLLLSDFDFEPWNPLTDDGDALRLAVKLKLCVGYPKLPGVEVWVACFVGNIFEKITESINTDPCAATRRAIVRAAAEIGRSME